MLWHDVVMRSPSAWYRHSYNLAEFHRCVAQDKNLEEHSFFILKNNEIIGLMPVLLMDNPSGLKEATYNGSPTPWPCFTDTNDIEQKENFAFDHFITICKENGVDRSLVGLNSPSLKLDKANNSFQNIVKNYRFIDESFLSHLALANDNPIATMRSSYRKKVRKFSKLYEASVHFKDTMSDDIEQAYFELHVKDAGGQFRPRESYTKMADLARKGEAAFIIARNIETGIIVGVLVIAIFKNAAYDSSVSIDPEYHQNYISHILKVAALRYLYDNGVEHYELGQVFNTPSISKIPDNKERNISFFKDGFARGIIKKSFVAERCFTDAALEHKISSIKQNLENFFELKHDTRPY